VSEQGPEGPRGEQGAEGPRGAQGVEGSRGTARGLPGARGPRGAPAPLRWAPAVGYVLLALVLGFLIFRVQTTCVDNRGDAAIRHQWARVASIIEHTAPQAKPGDPGYIPPSKAGELFADSYRDAIREAGPAPDCRGLLP